MIAPPREASSLSGNLYDQLVEKIKNRILISNHMLANLCDAA